MRGDRGGTRGRSRSEGWSWGWSEGWVGGKGSAQTRRCSCARSDAMTGGCSEAKDSPSHIGDSRAEREFPVCSRQYQDDGSDGPIMT
jgi:hypothetical protein